MKTLTLLLASLVLVTQSYAFGASERNLILGLGAGAIIATALHSKDTHVTQVRHTRTVYVEPYYERDMYERKHERKIARENRRHEKELRRENRRHERHYSSHHEERHQNKHYKKNHHSYNRAYASNNSHRYYRY